MISAAFPYQKQRRRVLGREMAYVEVGEGDPIVLLHGNPTSSYLWRNVLPHLQPLGRCIAPDLIGMGDSEKLPDSGRDSYRFVEHRRYLDALLEALDVRERVTFVIHDWGSALGFDWSNRRRKAVKGIAFMETIVRPQGWDHWDKTNMRSALQGLRSEAGEEMVLRDNFFIEKILPGAILAGARAPPLRGGQAFARSHGIRLRARLKLAGNHVFRNATPLAQGDARDLVATLVVLRGATGTTSLDVSGTRLVQRQAWVRRRFLVG
jgi:pimeloyl-ACP methyl ester carboxylesterase